MGKRKPKTSERNKNIKKQQRIENIQKRKDLKFQRIDQSEPIEICNLEVKKLISLSYGTYQVFCISSLGQKIAYWGVFSNGLFNYSIICNIANEIIILDFIKDYICKLGLTPKENPNLFKAEKA